jgi:hypothetical protein
VLTYAQNVKPARKTADETTKDVTNNKSSAFRRIESIGLFAICLSIIFPALFNLGSPRLLIIAAGSLCLSIVLFRMRNPFALGPILFGIFAVSLVYYARAWFLPEIVTNLTIWFVVFPVYFLWGYLSEERETWNRFGRIFVAMACFSSVLGIAEVIAGVSFFQEVMFSRAGWVRSIVGSENPLVLGVLLLCGISFTQYFSNTNIRRLATVVLLLGIVATGSRGPAVIGLGVAAIANSRRTQLILMKVSRTLSATFIIGYFALVYASFFIFQPTVTATSDFQYSSNHRLAMHALIPNILSYFPRGTFPKLLPSGYFLIYFQQGIIVDLSRTIDSELVYLVGQWGWLGIIIVGLVVYIVSRSLERVNPITICGFAIMIAGSFVAVSTWRSLGTLSFALLGYSLKSVLRKSNGL